MGLVGSVHFFLPLRTPHPHPASGILGPPSAAAHHSRDGSGSVSRRACPRTARAGRSGEAPVPPEEKGDEREGGASCGTPRPRPAVPPPHPAVGLAHGLGWVKGGGCGPRGGGRRRAAPWAPFPGAYVAGRAAARACGQRPWLLRHPRRGGWAVVPCRSLPLPSSLRCGSTGSTSSPCGLGPEGPSCLLVS